MNLMKRWLRKDDGASGIEYALIAVLIALTAMVGMRMMGGGVDAQLSASASEFDRAVEASPTRADTIYDIEDTSQTNARDQVRCSRGKCERITDHNGRNG